MTRRKSTPPEAALVAIDVAKHRNEVLIEAVRGGRRRRMTILNTRADHDKLVTTLLTVTVTPRFSKKFVTSFFTASAISCFFARSTSSRSMPTIVVATGRLIA